MEEFHTFCLNVEANQEVLHFSGTSSGNNGQDNEYIDVAEYTLKTDSYVVGLTQEDIDGGTGCHRTIVVLKTDESSAAVRNDAETMVDDGADNKFPQQNTTQTSTISGDNSVKEEYLESDGQIDGDEDEVDDDSDCSDFIEDMTLNDDNLFGSHEQFAGFPRVIVKNSKLVVRGAPLQELIEKFYRLECDLCPTK